MNLYISFELPQFPGAAAVVDGDAAANVVLTCSLGKTDHRAHQRHKRSLDFQQRRFLHFDRMPWWAGSHPDVCRPLRILRHYPVAPYALVLLTPRRSSMWKIARGARKLIYLSRSAADKPEAAELVRELEDMSENKHKLAIHVVRGDVSKRDDVAKAISMAGNAPIKGVVQAAMVLKVRLTDNILHRP